MLVLVVKLSIMWKVIMLATAEDSNPGINAPLGDKGLVDWSEIFREENVLLDPSNFVKVMTQHFS